MSKTKSDKWEFYREPVGGRRRDWRWRRVARNGRIVATSSEGYARWIDCEANAKRNGWDGERES